MPFSILILTKNEADNLPGCLQSVQWCDDVVVLDSFSTDNTCAVARDGGARVFQRVFDDFGQQRNFALENIDFVYPWVFHLDADERFNEELRKECELAVTADRFSAFFVSNRMIFLGKWIKRSSQYPYPQVRLLKIGEVHFAKSGHGQKEENPRRGLGYLQTPYDHYNFSKGIADWVERHNRYSSEEAQSLLAQTATAIEWRALFFSQGIERKRLFKQIHGRLPGRWMMKFIYLYFWKRGFLDGYPGFIYCALQGFYDLLIEIKVRERAGRKN